MLKISPDTEAGTCRTAVHGAPSDWLLTLLVMAQPALSSLAGYLLDFEQVIVDSSGNTVLVTAGSARLLTELAIMALVSLLALHIVVRGLLQGRHPFTLLGATALVVLLSEFLRGSASPRELMGIAVGSAVLVAAGVLRVDARLIRRLGIWGAVFLVSVWVAFLLDPEGTTKTCRPDKCSVIGSLLSGYMVHENVLGLYVACLVPAFALFSRMGCAGATALALLTVGATGSRTAFLTAVVATGALVLLRSTWSRHTGSWSRKASAPLLLGASISVVPLVGTIASLLFFLMLPPAALTGRGTIYALVRDEVARNPIYGPGSRILEQAYYASRIDYLAPHPHNQAGYLLMVGGVVALAFFMLAVASLAVVGVRRGALYVAVFAAAPSLSFVTEEIWAYDFFSIYLWTMLLTIALYRRAIETPPDLFETHLMSNGYSTAHRVGTHRERQ